MRQILFETPILLSITYGGINRKGMVARNYFQDSTELPKVAKIPH